MAGQVKVHLALKVSGLEESVKFYRAMFGVAPVKWKPGYAKFDIAEPSLNLTLNQGEVNQSGGAQSPRHKSPRHRPGLGGEKKIR